MRLLKLFFMVSIPLFFVTGCLSPAAVSPSSRYTFETWPKTLTIPHQSQTQKTLMVATPVASPGYQSYHMIYVQIPYQLQAYADHRWVSPPAELLLPLMANRLRTTGYFKAVVTPPFSGVTSYVLCTQLLMLQQEFLQPESSVHMIMEASLIRTSTNQVIANRVFEVRVPSPGNNPYSGVLAANAAAHVLMSKIALFTIKNAR